MGLHIDQNIATNAVSTAPPSFDDQIKTGSFNRHISFIKNVKNKFSTLFGNSVIENKDLSAYDISTVSKIQENNENEMLIINSNLDTNKPFKLNYNFRKNLLSLLKNKGFSVLQARNIFSNKFRICKSYVDVENAVDDIPSETIYQMGFNGKKETNKYFEEQLQYLVKLGYNETESRKVIVDAFNQASSKKEFTNYISSLPKNQDYNKGYLSNQDIINVKKEAFNHLLQIGYDKTDINKIIENFFNISSSKEEFYNSINSTLKYQDYSHGYSNKKDIINVKKKAFNHLLKLGYSKDDAKIISEEKSIESTSKDNFLYNIKQIPTLAIHKKGYQTMDDYLHVQKYCIKTLMERLGHSHEKATKIAIKYQKNISTRSEFVWKIQSIHS